MYVFNVYVSCENVVLFLSVSLRTSTFGADGRGLDKESPARRYWCGWGLGAIRAVSRTWQVFKVAFWGVERIGFPWVSS